MAPQSKLQSIFFVLSAVRICLLLFVSPSSAQQTTPSSKRGLVFTPQAKWPGDNYIWARPASDLTWYYNYDDIPSPAFSNTTQDAFEFVPMLWGSPPEPSDTSFLRQVRSLIDAGTNITHVMAFNEPDGQTSTGGSQVDPALGAQVWVNNFIPLQKAGVRVGLPACTGGWSGIPWLDQFLGNCSKLVSSSHSVVNCTFDFVPLHWYGNFQGLASHIGQYRARCVVLSTAASPTSPFFARSAETKADVSSRPLLHVQIPQLLPLGDGI